MNVSVVIPLYNGEEHIGQTLDSVLAQTLSPEEIVVVDDGSTDSSVSIASAYPEVELYENPGNGPNAARNHGLRKTSAENIAFLDQDDLWHPEHLERLMRSLKNEPDAPAAVAGKTDFHGGGDPRYSIKSYDYSLHDPWEDYPGNPYGEPFLAVIRRDALAAVDGWATQYDGSGDACMWFKLGFLGPLALNESSTAAHRITDSAESSRLRENQLLRYYGQRVDLSHELLKCRERKKLRTEPYRWRFQAQKATLELLKVVLPDEDGSLDRAATQFDQSVSEKDWESVRPVWSLFQWYATPFAQESGATRLLDLVDHWPHTDSELRNLLQEWAFSYTPAPDLVKRYPWNLSCWRLLLRRGYDKIRSKAV